MKTIISQSNVTPMEWDVKSSPTTVWHNYDVEEIKDDDGTFYQYKTDKMTHQEYNLYLVKKLQEQKSANNALGQQLTNLTLSNAQKDEFIKQIGQQVTELTLDVATLKGGNK